MSSIFRSRTNFFCSAKVWNEADCLLIHKASLSEDETSSKSSNLHQYLFGYEIPDTVILLTKEGAVTFLGTSKKCKFLEPAKEALPRGSIQSLDLLVKNKEDNNVQNYQELWNRANLNKSKAGLYLKERASNLTRGGLLQGWEEKLNAIEENQLVDITQGVSFVLSVKDTEELDTLKKSSVLSNKVMKHGLVKKMEAIIDSKKSITHEALAQEIDDIIEDPSKIGLKVPTDDSQSPFFPIIQSGGDYDLKVSATSNSKTLSHDVITASLGAKYLGYCSTISRTFLVDPPKAISDTYEVLVDLHEACLAAMKPGNQLKDVYQAAVKFLQQNDSTKHLIDHLPKNFGFGIGIDFRDSSFLLSPKNSATFRKGMTFCLSVSFQNLSLSESDKSDAPDGSPIKNLESYSLQIADTVALSSEGADVMTKMGKSIEDIAYNTKDGDSDEDEESGDDDDDDESVEAPDAPEGDEEMAKKLARERGGTRASSRLAKDKTVVDQVSEGAADRERKQIDLMKRRNEERLRELARASRNKGGDDDEEQAEELVTYKRSRDYPEKVLPNQVMVDMPNQCVILPIYGNPVPFHISTIKNVVMPEVEGATLLRINFYTAGMALGKDAPSNMVKLVQKYAPYASFIREMTFRSLDGNNLTLAFRQISELRKRARQRELRLQEEADLVEQEKLVRTKNERVPRLADLTMRPTLSGQRKTQGNLEAHTNGLRFISSRQEVVDIMYNNIKYAIYQPCEREIMVLIHFHLKNPIMIGKKKQKDVQFYTEVVDASQAVDNARRSVYDPDEMDDEQRERQLRKKLNKAFKDFCKKVDDVAKRHGHVLEFDLPYTDLGFTGNPHREMVTIVPTLNCLVNLTETPFFVVDLESIDHVHFERVTYMSKAFDMVLVSKNFSEPVKRIDMIPSNDKEAIQEWLTDMEITYTEGPMNLNWKQIMATIKEDDRFYMNTEEDEVTEKEAGWEFLRMYGDDEGEEEEQDGDDSEFDEEGDESEASDDESEVDEFLSDEEDEDEDFDADEDLEEQGMDWDEMEAQAAADDKRKRARDEDEQLEVRKPKKRKDKQRRR